MKHTAAFTAARDALAQLLAQGEHPQIDATREALTLTAAALLTLTENEPAALDVPRPADPAPLTLLTAAREVLGEYAPRDLPAWGSAERDRMMTALTYAVSVLDLMATLLELGTGSDPAQAPSN